MLKSTKMYNINKTATAMMLVIATVVSCILFSVKPTFAAVSQSAFAIEKYTMTADVNRDHTYDIKQTVDVSIPENMKSMKLVLSGGGVIVDGVDAGGLSFVTSTENGIQYITITEPNALTAGKHSITITYRIVELAEHNEGKDKFYFNALLPEWRQPVGAVDITVNMPGDFDWSDMQYYAGQFGIQDEGNKANFDVDEAKGTVRITGVRIPENFGITMMGDLPDGYWQDPLDGKIFISIGTGIVALMMAACFIMWLIGGRDPKTGRSRQTHPIEGISPAELGYIFEGKVRRRDIIALLLYLATKGYLRISEYSPRKYRLYRVEEPKNEEKYIRSAYGILFEGIYEDRAIELDDAWPRLARIADSISIDIESGFSSSDMLAQRPISRILRIINAVIATAAVALISILQYAYQFIDISYNVPLASAAASLALLVAICIAYDRADFEDNSRSKVLIIVLGVLYAAVSGYQLAKLAIMSEAYLLCGAMLASVVVMLVMAVLMNSRGKGNAKLVGKYRSMRRFIYKAEPKSVSEYLKEDPNYYYDMVPYAYLFQGLETWAKAFKWMGVSDPDWYSDDIEGHALTYSRHKQTTIDVARAIKSFCRTLETGRDAMHRIHLHK